MDSEKEPLNQDGLEAETYNNLETDKSYTPDEIATKQLEYDSLSKKSLFWKFFIVAVMFLIAYVVIAVFYGALYAITVLIDFIFLTLTYFVTVSYKCLLKNSVEQRKFNIVTILASKFKKKGTDLTDDQLNQAIVDRFYEKASSYQLPSSNFFKETNSSGKRLFTSFPNLIHVFDKPILLTLALLVVISWVPMRLLILTNFVCKCLIFYFFIDMLNYFFANHLKIFLLNGHGISAIRPNDTRRAIWVQCLVMVCLLAIGGVWSGVKLAFETILFIFWLISLFGKGFVNMFKRRQKKLI